MSAFRRDGVTARQKPDGTPVTDAYIAVETALQERIRKAFPNDGFLGEEVGEMAGTSGRRWIVDGIDGTSFFCRGAPTWGTLIALEVQGAVTASVITSPAQHRRWWAGRGQGAHTAGTNALDQPTRLRVAAGRARRPDRVIVLPAVDLLEPRAKTAVRELAGGDPPRRSWSHPLAVASGEADLAVWFGGGPWDLAAPALLVQEAGGRFSDHTGGQDLTQGRAVFSNGIGHDDVVALLRTLRE